MTKRIGILTFHYANNHGAVLQAYALRKIINSLPDCCAEIINYVPEGYSYSVSDEKNLTNEYEKRDKFEKFLSMNCGIHTPMIHSVCGNTQDIYIVGSDQIWNMDIPEAAADCEYFLPHLDDKAKRMAYAASIGTDFDRIDKELFRKYLSKFNAISLREKSYVGIISELSGKECEYTLDPTLLLREKDYEKLLEKPNTKEEAYVLWFWYDFSNGGFDSVETVNMLARKYGLSIKHTISSDSCPAKHLLVNDGGNMFQSGIGEFLWYVKNAKVIVTDSFHGAVFSLIFGKPVYLYYPRLRRCRQENLVELLGLQDRVIQGYVNSDRLNLEMDYDSVYSILEKERERSIAYLKNTIAAV